MKRKHFLLFWILAILLACAACTETGDAITDSGHNAQNGNNSISSSNTETDTNTTKGGLIEGDSSSDAINDTTGNTDTNSTPSAGTSNPSTTPSQGSSSEKPAPSTDNVTATKPSTGTTNSTTPSTNTGTSNGGTQNSGTGTATKLPLNAIAPENYYGRTWLKSQSNGANLVAAYDSIATAAEAMTTSVTFANNITVDQLHTVVHCYRNDYPEHFWVDADYTYLTNGSAVKGVTLKYTMSATQKASAQKEFNKAVDKLLEGLDGSMNQFDLEKILHDRLVLAITYKDGTHAHDAYGAIVKHTAVCDGYARAFQLLCRKVGIRAIIAEGESDNPGSGNNVGHAWNVVQINGKFYHVDVTWDDAGEPDDEHGIHYAWFNITSKQLTEDHILSDSGYDIPKCDSEEENYFLKTGKWLEELTVDGILSLLEDHGGEYHAHIYLKNYDNVKAFFQKNIFAIVSELECYSYSFRYQNTGHGIYLIIRPQ